MSRIPNILSSDPRSRLKLGCASVFCLLISTPLVVAFIMMSLSDRESAAEDWMGWLAERLFFELALTLFILSWMALLYAIFTPRWVADVLEQSFGKAFLVAILAAVLTFLTILIAA